MSCEAFSRVGKFFAAKDFSRAVCITHEYFFHSLDSLGSFLIPLDDIFSELECDTFDSELREIQPYAYE